MTALTEHRKYGLIGYPLSHSFSPSYFAKKFKEEGIEEVTYEAFPIEDIKKVERLFESGISGLNVTIPYKEQVIPFLDDLDPTAKQIGAVNTIKNENGRWIGYNTDVYGFQKSLSKILIEKSPKSALILGTGGSSKAVVFALTNMGIDYSFVSRNKAYLQYNELSKRILDHHLLIINTTPLGMSPNINICPNIPYKYISSEHFCFDLVYNPEKTLFLNKAEACGATIKNGYEMLILQAEKSWQIWNQ